MAFKDILVRIFGKPKWPFAPIELEDTNPCLAATLEWQKKQSVAGKNVGMVWYYIRGDKKLYHCVGYEEIDGARLYYDAVHEMPIKLTATELEGAEHIPWRAAE